MTAFVATGAALPGQLVPLVAWYETLSPESLARLPEFYTHDARFRDPFNDVRGTAQIETIFRHMFQVLAAPRFVVREVFCGESVALLVWDFHFRLRGRAFSIQGCSRLSLGDDGRVLEHLDYWDSASELFARLPVLGAAVRWLLRRMAANR